jgi:hypothetical protein
VAPPTTVAATPSTRPAAVTPAAILCCRIARRTTAAPAPWCRFDMTSILAPGVADRPADPPHRGCRLIAAHQPHPAPERQPHLVSRQAGLCRQPGPPRCWPVRCSHCQAFPVSLPELLPGAAHLHSDADRVLRPPARAALWLHRLAGPEARREASFGRPPRRSPLPTRRRADGGQRAHSARPAFAAGRDRPGGHLPGVSLQVSSGPRRRLASPRGRAGSSSSPWPMLRARRGGAAAPSRRQRWRT